MDGSVEIIISEIVLHRKRNKLLNINKDFLSSTISIRNLAVFETVSDSEVSK